MRRSLILVLCSCLLVAADDETGGSGAFMAGSGAGGRSGGGRTVVRSKAPEDATTAGLRFLARHQAADGSWDAVTYPLQCPDGPRCEPGQGGPDDTVALTAQALLTYLGSGYDHKSPNRFRPVVMRGFAWLLAQQGPDGASGATVATQALAAMALCEAYAMTADPELRRPAQAAIDRLLALRVPGADGRPLAWGRASEVDTADTCTAILALKSAIAGGLPVGDGLEQARIWLEAAWQAANPGHARLDAAQGTSVFPAAWSPAGCRGEESEAGAVAAIFLGRKPGDVLLETLATTVAAHVPEVVGSDLRRVYLGGLVQFQLGGPPWARWHPVVRDALLTSQHRQQDCFYGSWDPRPELGGPHARGRLQATVWAEFRLQLYYCYDRTALPKK